MRGGRGAILEVSQGWGWCSGWARLAARTAEDVEVAVHAQRPEGGRPHREGHLDRDIARHIGRLSKLRIEDG